MEKGLEEVNALRDADFAAYNEAMKHVRECRYVVPGGDRPVRPMEKA